MRRNVRKCIGVILARPENEYQSSILKGIYETAFANDMNVAVFVASLYDEGTAFANHEFNIFSSINFDLLAGIIHLPETFSPINIDEKINAKLIEANKRGLPVVTIDGHVSDFPCYSSADQEGINALVNHFTSEHECKRIAFMTGPEGHGHAERRLEAFRVSMAEKNLDVPEDWIYYGDFWYNKGEDFVNKLMESKEGMPEAVLCANEFMACSVYKALKAKGYSVPSKVRLGCFATDLGTMKFLTTVITNPLNVAQEACNGLICMINGEKLDSEQKVHCEFLLRKALTCGCMPFEDYDYFQNDGMKFFEDDGYFSEYNDINENLHNSRDMEDLFWRMDWFTHYIKEFRGMYFCMYDGWNNPVPIERHKKNMDTMQLYFYRKRMADGNFDKHVGTNIVFPKELMHPNLLSAEGEPSSYIFRELHCFEEDLGYIVLDNGNDMTPYDVTLNFFLKDVTTAIEAQNRMESINYMFGMDIMTGIRNRNAFNVMMPELIQQAKDSKAKIMLALCDLNGLKFVNDTFGHNEGDEAIKVSSKMLSGCHMYDVERELDFRIGGDEFVKVVIGDITQEKIDKFKKELREDMDSYNASSHKEYPIYLSVGECVRSYDENINLDEILFVADKKMYSDKQRLKDETGFRPERQ